MELDQRAVEGAYCTSLPLHLLRNIKFESIPEMGPIPPILSDFSLILKNGDLRGYLDQCPLSRILQTSLAALKDRLRLPPGIATGEETYEISLMNAVVMYIGVSSVAQVKARSGTSTFVLTDPGVVALTYLAYNLDPEGASVIFFYTICDDWPSPSYYFQVNTT